MIHKMYLVNYTDTTDGTKGTICVMQERPQEMSDEIADVIKTWVNQLKDAFDMEDESLDRAKSDLLYDLRIHEQGEIFDYEVYIEETHGHLTPLN